MAETIVAIFSVAAQEHWVALKNHPYLCVFTAHQ
jgi:hypothetical protein